MHYIADFLVKINCSSDAFSSHINFKHYSSLHLFNGGLDVQSCHFSELCDRLVHPTHHRSYTIKILSAMSIYNGNRKCFHLCQCTRSNFTVSYIFLQKIADRNVFFSKITESVSVSENKFWNLQNLYTIAAVKLD